MFYVIVIVLYHYSIMIRDVSLVCPLPCLQVTVFRRRQDKMNQDKLDFDQTIGYTLFSCLDGAEICRPIACYPMPLDSSLLPPHAQTLLIKPSRQYQARSLLRLTNEHCHRSRMACQSASSKEEQQPTVGGAIKCLLQLVHLQSEPAFSVPVPSPHALAAQGELQLAIFFKESSILQLPRVPQPCWLKTGVPLSDYCQCSSVVPNKSSHQAGVLLPCLFNPTFPHSNCVGCVSTDYLVANARPKLNGTARSLGRPSLNPAGTLSSSYWSLVTVANKVYAYSLCSAV